MMNFALTTTSILDYAKQEYPEVKLVSKIDRDQTHTTQIADFALRVNQLANALIASGIKAGDRVATLAWNNHRHLELYYAISGIGAICHTINPRYSPTQIQYIVNHAQDKALYFDSSFTAIAKQLKSQNESIENYVCLSGKHAPQQDNDFVFEDYETVLAKFNSQFVWPELDENSGSALCYTSGTTGDPKGVLYTHRSTCLHSIMSNHRGFLDIDSSDVICPIVPMFHVNAWGLPYTALMSGASLVLPGANMQADALFTLLDEESVTFIAGVPTILTALYSHMKKLGRKPKALKRMLVGGAAASQSLIDAFEKEFDICVYHGWGMTETSPMATLCTPKPVIKNTLSSEQQLQLKTKQGRRPYGVELKLVNAQGQTLPHDGKAFGDLLVKGAWVSDRYYGQDKPATDKGGWFDTGDIATIDENGYMQIVDRNKDVIKSGGEWISSVELENTVLACEGVSQAAVIGLPHEKWTERPLMLLVKEPGSQVNESSVKVFLSENIPTWWMPDAILFVNELPIGATGKVQKKELREQYSSFKSLTEPA
jgi:fatty-acyl-CoA synthase